MTTHTLSTPVRPATPPVTLPAGQQRSFAEAADRLALDGWRPEVVRLAHALVVTS
jgi:hypothetical protein